MLKSNINSRQTDGECDAITTIYPDQDDTLNFRTISCVLKS